jgi:uncharacterized YigZ family protein
MDGSYDTVAGFHAAEITVKGSRFIGCIAPCGDDAALHSLLEDVRMKLPAATHYCYAALVGGGSRQERFSDNGEPSGTAGRPILSVIRGSGLADVAIVVVRYFGGTLLGTGGLVQAYTESSKLAMSGSERVRMELCRTFAFRLDYSQYGRFESIFRDLAACGPEVVFAEAVEVSVSVRDADSDRAFAAIMEIVKDKVPVRDIGVGYKPINL